MKNLFIICLLIICTTSTEVLVTDQCNCAQLLSQSDCTAKNSCSWTQSTSLCSTTTISNSKGYCESISDSAECAKSKGCAYINSNCQIFAGCTAYLGTSDGECQAISKWCNSDGIAYCIIPGACKEYKSNQDCSSKVSSSSDGSGTCVWDNNICREQKCSEADTTFTSDAQCNKFIKGCVTTGKGCSNSQLGKCSSFTGDVQSCDGLKGSDGYCIGTEGQTTCTPKLCSSADVTLVTDTECANYQIGCVTTGYGCTLAPLGKCSTLFGDDTVCKNKVGSDGKCKGVSGGTYCSLVTCTDADSTLTSDSDCDTFKSGCVTTGKGCIASRSSCSSYTGTISTCNGYIGSNGKCQGSSDTDAACSSRVCIDADTTHDSDSACDDYQNGCVTTGKGCISTLSTCSSYTGDATTCEGYIGTDGKCKGQNTSGSCLPKLCNEAPTSLTTNQDCNEYQIGCITTENGGCMTAGTCSSLLVQSQCDGKSTCQWNPQCVKNTICSDLNSEILCKTVTLQNNTTCWWVNGSCIARLCTHALNTLKSDTDCNLFLKGCLTNGQGCLDSLAPCSSYTGTKTQCEAFTLKCTNADDTTIDACDDVLCTSNTTATTDSACDSYHKGCLTTNPGCIAASASCSAYSGTSTEICGKFTGNNGTTPCWWLTGSNNCTNKECSHAAATTVADSDCKTFLKGCVTNGGGCISNTTHCTGYSGTQDACNTFSELIADSQVHCTRRETCLAEVGCSAIVATDQNGCDAVLPRQCYYVKGKCMSVQNCENYTSTSGLTLNECKNVKDTNGNECYWVNSTYTQCVTKYCNQILNPLSLDTCTAHLSKCAKMTDGSKCEDFDCSHAPATDESTCQSYHPSCHYKYNGTNYVCAQAASCTDQARQDPNDCVNAVADIGKCMKPNPVDSNNQYACADLTCSQINLNDCNTTKILNFAYGLMGAAIPQYCIVYNNQCIERSCPDALTQLNVVINSVAQCNAYLETCILSYDASGVGGCIFSNTDNDEYGCALVSGTPDQCMNMIGKYQINSTLIWIKCYKHDGAVDEVNICADRTCDQVENGITDEICQNYMPTCKTNGQSCVDYQTSCASMSGTVDSCKNLTGIIPGSKCRANASTSGLCTSRRCQDNGIATTDIDCDSYLSGCITTGKGCIDGTVPCSAQYGNQDGCKLLTGNSKKCWSLSTTDKGQCIDRICSHNTTATIDKDCISFMDGCVTKGTGCIDNTSECTAYNGTQSDCEKFTANGKSCTNDTTATATSACKSKDCTTFTNSENKYSERVCQIFGKHCHYNGTKCDVIQTCSNLKGNIVTCTGYVASDGPCIGTALLTNSVASCAQATCSDAPYTLITDSECDSFKSGCRTNGAGCGTTINCEDVQTQDSCLAVINDSNPICAWATQCRDIASTCSSYTQSGQSVCLQTKTTSGFGVCVWKSNSCTEAACEDLPKSTSDESGCTTYSMTCTFAGEGCVTKGLCTSYITETQCKNASSTDNIGSCSWDTSVLSSIGGSIIGCRAKNCSDAPITLSSDEDCATFIPGCRTNGAGCVSPPFTCSQLKTQEKCLQDSSLQPCLWFDSACIQYTKCEDLVLKTVQQCQAVSKYCTSDESKCIALKVCATYTKQVQCVVGTDGVCGWINSTKKCALYTQCSDLTSKVNSECQAFNIGCISNGTACIPIGECSSYADSQDACKLGGTDGTCYFDTATTSCRLRTCADATTSNTTHNGCFGFSINSTTKCTTDGSGCISLADCTSYTKLTGCMLDDKLNPCTWDKTAKSCKQKVCSDIKKSKSNDCNNALAGCISDGTTCITQAKCATYTTKESCGAGGTDGSCVFSPTSSTSPTAGTCKLFSQCSDASSDQTACKSKSATCKWSAASGTTTSSCINHTCDTVANGSAKCVTIPNFEGTKYTVCQVQGGKCVTGDPSALTSDACYKLSQFTYSWSTTSKKCIACGSGAATNVSNTANNDSTLQTIAVDGFGNLISHTFLLMIIFLQ